MREGGSIPIAALFDGILGVPVVLMGFGVKAGRYAGEAGPEDIAPSFERILGVEERVEPDARVLEEALQ